MDINNKLDELKNILKKAELFNHAISILNFDVETIAPKDALEDENETINYFSNEYFKMLNNDNVNSLIVYLHDNIKRLDYYDQLLIEKLYESYLKSKNITPEFDLKRNQIYSKGYMAWLDAKEKKDYNLFKEAFNNVINIQKEEINLRDNKFDSLYDNMLNDCEKGLLQAGSYA